VQPPPFPRARRLAADQRQFRAERRLPGEVGALPRVEPLADGRMPGIEPRQKHALEDFFVTDADQPVGREKMRPLKHETLDLFPG